MTVLSTLLNAAKSCTKMGLEKLIPSGLKEMQPQAKHLGIWFAASATMVFITAKMGGIVRLIEAGMPAVPWPTFLEVPPFTSESWQEYYNEYVSLPESRRLENKLSFDDFKYLWRLEFSNRVCKWLMCASFFAPATYFLVKGYQFRSTKRMILLFGLFLYQSLIEWQIVNSSSERPRVSQYHLAASFGSSIASYLLLLKLALEELLLVQHVPVTAGAVAVRRLSAATQVLAFITAVSGSFVAGLDGGLIYNTFPKMGDNWIPDDILQLSPVIRNFVENPTTAQFDHRVLAVSTTSLCLTVGLLSVFTSLPRRARYAAISLALMTVTQAGMGIYSLVNKIPTVMTSGHQSGALLVLSCAAWLSHELQFAKRI